MFYVYIIYSRRLNKYYVGSTYNLDERLARHNQGRSKFTRAGIPWDLVYFEEYKVSAEAVQREKEIKNKRSRIYINRLIRVTCRASGRSSEHPD